MHGFEYWCLVDSNELRASYNAGSVTCLVGSFQVKDLTGALLSKIMALFCSSQHNALSFQLLWRGGGLQYSIDENFEDDIRYRLP